MKVRVLKEFVDTHTKGLHKVIPGEDNIIEMTEERFAEAVANLKKYGGGFIEAAEKKVSDMNKDELVAYAKEKGIDLGEAKLKPDILAVIKAAEKKE